MPRTPSTMTPLGRRAPQFDLPDPSGQRWSLSSCRGERGILVMFLCNHCPFVKHVAHAIRDAAAIAHRHGVGVVGINSNDARSHPEDAPPKMAEAAAGWGWTFPYLVDEAQTVAAAYEAACTPDFFLFDTDLKLVYRGQLDGARPGNDIPSDGRELISAIEHLAQGRPIVEPQQPSIGCNIKWKPGHEPAFAR